jgi:hypothetical protein
MTKPARSGIGDAAGAGDRASTAPDAADVRVLVAEMKGAERSRRRGR